MTGTALTEAEEFDKIYKLAVLPIPTNLEYQRHAGPIRPDRDRVQGRRPQVPLLRAARTTPRRRSSGAARTIPTWSTAPRKPSCAPSPRRSSSATSWASRCWWAPPRSSFRSAFPTACGRSRSAPGPGAALRDAWFEANNTEEDGMLVEALKPLSEDLYKLVRQDLAKQLKEYGLSSNPVAQKTCRAWPASWACRRPARPRWPACCKAGIPHHVLNAKQHDEESPHHRRRRRVGRRDHRHQHGRPRGGHQAGRRDGRGSRHRRQPRAAQSGQDDPYDMTNEERRAALLKIARRRVRASTSRRPSCSCRTWRTDQGQARSAGCT